MICKFVEDSIYSKSFYSCGLNEEKYVLFYNKTVIIRDFKNDISYKIHKDIDIDIDKYIDMSKNDMIIHFNTQITGLLGTDIQNAITDVHTAYSNKFEQINNKIQFKIYTLEYLFYLNNSKKNLYVKGDVKNRKFKSHSTKFTAILTYLAKYCKNIDETIIYLTSKLPLIFDIKQQLFYIDIIQYIYKYGKDRIFNLISLKKLNIKNKYNTKSIEFKSLTFRTTSKINHNIISYNDNYNSDIKTFITVGGIVDNTGKGNRIHIPVRYSKKYHGDMKEFNNFKNQKNGIKYNINLNIVSYTVVLDEKNKQLIIVLIKKDKRETYINGTNRLGVDINVKHNLFSTSDNITFDYDRELFSDYIKFLKYLDNVKSIKAKMKLSKEEISRISNRNKVILEYYQIRILNDLRKKCSDLVKYCKLNDIDHIVLEDLSLFGKSFSRSEEFEGFKYSRLTRLLNLASIKEIIKGIAYKNGISISFVHPHYTSQQCPKCGHIHRDNRKTQEEFKCTNCGYTDNSDYVSSLNIENRISVNVLQESLLKTNKKGEFEPKILSKEFIKTTLLLAFE